MDFYCDALMYFHSGVDNPSKYSSSAARRRVASISYRIENRDTRASMSALMSAQMSA
jgi:hypothetical protein